ncbi:ZIP family metal transporter [Shewanella violacea]|uniref:Uncharacterized protein n=1 Tax=Shewanella violacea (strain JCM 10179 / CIP 106290 / LMG 19151 / DSS12) TaxID=637905 RepID=D4ZJT8_SHEVD|nr:ZIP family metal transporter [Shewanella violacea]BAJ01937.1 conserved hypothetical protein [Shewanella violacea DSS12]
MIYLAVSCLSLLICPLFYRYLSASHGLLKGLDGFIFITLSGLVILHILPDIIAVGGALSLAVVILGIITPTLSEKLFKNRTGTTHAFAVSLSIFGLMLHNITDGCSVMLAQQADASIMLAVGVILHRIPEGLAIWWMVQPRVGTLWACLALALMLVMTCIGYFAGGEVMLHLDLASTVYIQAFVAGAIMHVLLHEHHEKECSDKELPARLGGLIGFGVIYLLVSGVGHDHHHHEHKPVVLDVSHPQVH